MPCAREEVFGGGGIRSVKVILEPREDIVRLWGEQRVKIRITYRPMKYLLRCEVEEGVLLHNVVTRQLILLSNDEKMILSDLPAIATEPMKELIENHFLVPEDFDEYRSVNQLRKICQSRSAGDAINHYIILPTTYCNAHCFYCYESDYPRVQMTEDTACKLIKYIDEHRRGKKVKLSWFGGEPLVGIARIDQISQGLRDRNVEYTSSMISNAYLFDEAVIRRSVDLWHLEDVQITLDGTEDVYNRVKAYVSAKDNPFHRVLRNIDLLSANGIHVNIRLNIDFYNKDDMGELIEQLGERYSGNKHISVYLNMLYSDQGFEPVHHSTDDTLKLRRIIDEYTQHLKELKLGSDRITIPSLQYSQCMADNPRAVEVQPDGSFCRCEHETITDAYGNLNDGILDPQKPIQWRKIIQRSSDCPGCCLYPACYLLQGCLDSKTPCTENLRGETVGKYEKLMRTVLQKRLKEDNRNEDVPRT